MGGEGGGVLADWIVDLAEHASHFGQKTSVPGVAQRTGSTIYYCEIFPESAALATRKTPVLALMPVPGELDVVIASELMECGRAIQRGLVTPDRTTLIASTHRVYSMSERTDSGDGRVDATRFIEAGEAAARTFVRQDFARIAQETGSVISAPLFGALAATGALPFSRAQFEDAIRRGGVGVDASLAAFAAGFQVSMQSSDAGESSGALEAKPRIGVRMRTLAARAESTFPGISHSILLAGVLRLGDYQDERYAAEYLDRLDGIRDLDSEYGPGDFALLRETGRYLALWMSYEDAIRVADLKIRRARFERVRDEAQAGDDQLVGSRSICIRASMRSPTFCRSRSAAGCCTPGTIRRMVERLTRQGRLVETTSLAWLSPALRDCEPATIAARSRCVFIASIRPSTAWLAQIPRWRARTTRWRARSQCVRAS